jgi:hypothetical protein
MRSFAALVIPMAVGLMYGAGATRAAAAADVLSVCDLLLDDPTTLNGRVLSIRGVLGGTDEGIWLWSDCKTHLVTDGIEWPNAVSVYFAESEDGSKRPFAKLDEALKGASEAHGEEWAH